MTATTASRPKLLTDLGAAERTGIIAALILGGIVLVHIARYDWAAVYYNLLESNAHVTSAYHSAIPDADYRHAGRYAIEGLYAGAAVQIALYNWARHWPPKDPIWLHKYVFRYLLIPTSRLPSQSFWCLAVSWLWMVIFAAPLFVLGLWLMTVTHTLPSVVTTSWNVPVYAQSETSALVAWQFPALGLVCSLAARPVIKGTAFHGQRLIIKERLENGHSSPAWWMGIFPYFKWRFEFLSSVDAWEPETANRRTSPLVRRTAWAVAVLAWLALTYQGWHILTFDGFSYTRPFLLHTS